MAGVTDKKRNQNIRKRNHCRQNLDGVWTYYSHAIGVVKLAYKPNFSVPCINYVITMTLIWQCVSINSYVDNKPTATSNGEITEICSQTQYTMNMK